MSNQIEKNFDFVIIDCPAGIDGGFRRAVDCADETIIVTTPHLSAVRDADKAIMVLQSRNKPYLIINRARGDLMLDSKMININSISDCLNASLIGVIPDDDSVSIQMLKGGAFDCESQIYKSLNMIAHNIVTGEKDIYDCTKKYRGIIGSIRKKIKKRV